VGSSDPSVPVDMTPLWNPTVMLLAIASAVFALIQAVDGNLLGDAPESVWMLLWGSALLFLGSEARSLLLNRGHARSSSVARTAVAEPRAVGSAVDLMIQTRS
jgi:hypothetical protein